MYKRPFTFIDLDVADAALDFLVELRATWSWKVGSTASNDRDIAELDSTIEKLKEICRTGGRIF